MLHEIDDDRPPLGITRGRDHPGRLVQEHVGERLGDEELPVEIDDVALLDERVQPGRHAVHTHAAALDQLVGAPPGGDAGAGEVRVQAHGESFTFGANRSPMRGSFLVTLTAGGGWTSSHPGGEEGAPLMVQAGAAQRSGMPSFNPDEELRR